MVSNTACNQAMSWQSQFRKLLPVLQTSLAILFGGWGLWIRNSVVSQPFWGSDGWHSTARFHVWPWPLKFAAILNLPALPVGGPLSWPLEYLRPGLPEWVSYIPVLLLIPVFWCWLGSWTDKYVSSGSHPYLPWILLLLFVFLSAAASSTSDYVGGYTSYLEFGIAFWLAVALGVAWFAAFRRRKSKVTWLPPSSD
jgi:hypothetical protein